MHLGTAARHRAARSCASTRARPGIATSKRSRRNGDYEVTFHLKRPQPAFLSLLAAGWSPVYPCHVPPREMRTKPIGTGPFKFVEFRPNEVIKTARNPDYWKPGRPYLDGIEWQIMPDSATRNLAFIAGKHDISSPYGTTVPLLNDVKSQAPQAECVLTSTNVSRNLILNPEKPPFDNPELRRAMALTLDRKAFIDIIRRARAISARRCCRRRKGLWGMPPEMLATLPGYDPDIAKNRAEARKIMEKLGYGPDKRLVGHGLVAQHPDLPRAGGDPDRPAAGRSISTPMLEPVETANWFPKIYRKDYTIGDQRHRERRRRSRPEFLRELCVRRGAELHRLLQ